MEPQDRPEPEVDGTHVGVADLAVEPEGFWARVKRYNKAIAAAGVNVIGVAILLVTGAELDPELALLIEGGIATLIVKQVRNS